ncbi:COR domain-containing protein [Candidatus Albibeggiatoa sp. nov. BB20]|uniref:COR domain-containing protein n=1 Tax=Candidatus Albibeggiatoa sp. nov. BB20 TaxID=3162723 RepID=UPI0033656E96
MNDLDIIKQLEKEIGRKLEQISLDKITNFGGKNGYAVDENNNVIGLNLDNNKLFNIPELLFLLKNLQKLILVGNRIETLPDSFLWLKKLKTLDLEKNNIKKLPISLLQLESLTFLNLPKNNIKNLPTGLGQLQNLSTLNLYRNQLKELPTDLGQLQNLVYLDVAMNQLKKLPVSLGQLHNLDYLRLERNELKDLPISIGQLQNLEELNISDNELRELPKPLIKQLSCHRFYADGNFLEIPPQEIADQGIEAIRNYFEELEKEQKSPLNEAKVLILGQGGVGKTSLVNRLIHQKYNDDENKTDGINVEKWQVNIANTKIRLNVWDFGGQEIMHATHQFFLTKRSLYILILDARQGETDSRLEYWLKMIQTYGANSPILIAVNKTDQHRLKLNKKFLQEKYPSIQGFFDISCKQNTGVKQLQTAMFEQIQQLPHVHDILPKSWFEIKQKLENMHRDFISYDEYTKICCQKKYQIKQTDTQKILIQLLHDLGIVLNFRDDPLRPLLKQINILKPKWVTDAVYTLINNNQLFKAKGVLKKSQLGEFLNNKRYPESQYDLLIQLMEKFELCFQMPDIQPISYLMTDLLDPEQPDINWDYENSLLFQYQYDVLPSSIFSRFLVRVHTLISQKTYWLTGAILTYDNNKALIKADLEDKRIFIWIDGTVQTRRILLGIIREKFKGIHNSFARLKVTEMLSYRSTLIPYDNLLKIEHKGRTTHYIPEIDEDINVKKILDEISDLKTRQQELETKLGERNVHIHGNIEKLNLNTGDNVTQTLHTKT